MSRLLIGSLILLFSLVTRAQRPGYTTAQAHSHNDYEQAFPFWHAWRQGFGSIEADIYLDNGRLVVAHEPAQIKRGWTLDSLYLKPLERVIMENKGKVYPDSGRSLQLMIDIKTEAITTLSTLVEVLKGYSSLLNAKDLKIVISGNRPDPAQFHSYPEWIRFDGELNKEYAADALKRIEMLSDNFARYSKWNGKGRLPEKEQEAFAALVQKAHAAGKKIRFWNAPDILNSWYAYIGLGVDFINTDDIPGISTFLKQLPFRTFTNDKAYNLYQPRWRNDGLEKPVKNIILIIGDGTGLAQWYAGYTANGGKLNVFNIRHTGFSKTSSYDNYITDSAPGATAFSSGTKTNNRAVGVDHTGARLTLLPEIIRRKKKMKTGIITSGDFRDATPAAFYAHQVERSSYPAILGDLLAADIDVIAGSCEFANDSVMARMAGKFRIFPSIDSLKAGSSTPIMIADKVASLSILNNRGSWLEKAFDSTIKILSKDKSGFLLMLEGAQVDHGGHANNLPFAVTELLDLDKVIGKALAFADSNGETLVIITGDHETGGLTLTSGNYETGMIGGNFSTGDHTAIPVPVFAYGPRSQLFNGVYENVEIFNKILKALQVNDAITNENKGTK